MNINETLFNSLNHDFYDYGCDYNEIQSFLFDPLEFMQRQNKAIKIIDGIMTMHGKQELRQHVSELARIEHGIRELEPWVRDHVVHALLSFLLGIQINENFFEPNGWHKVSTFQWKLAGLFHDIGYPMQIGKDIIKPFINKINEIKRKIGVIAPDIQFRIIPIGLEYLQNKQNSFILIQNCIDQLPLDIDVKEEFERMIRDGNICHGIISALTVLYVIDLMYQRYNPRREYIDTYADYTNINWNQINFETEIVPACSAIYIHNLPVDRFNNSKLDPAISPLPFLLKLADTLQEWERPSLDNITGFPADEFDIAFDNESNLVFTSTNAMIRNKIQTELNHSIIGTKIILR
jgi:hypothetical protein